MVDPPQQVDFALKSPATTTLSCLLATLFVIVDSVSMYLEYASLFMLGEQYPLKQKTSPTRTPTIPSLLTSVVSSGSLPLRSVTHIEASPLVSLNQCGSCLFGSEIIIISGLSSIAHWCIMSCASLHLLRFICSILIYSLSTAFYILDKPGIRLRGQISLLSPCCRWSSRVR